MNEIIPYDPTQNIELDFPSFAAQRSLQRKAHMVDGVPDYAFSLDAQIRARLASVGILRAIGQALVSAVVPIQRQLLQMDCIAVGPRQFPEVYALGEGCAKTLGIGIPQMFVKLDPLPNAFTFCTNETDQLIVMTSGLVNACSPVQLMSVIGHECGHIHNQHTVYNIIWEYLTNPLANGLILSLLNSIPILGQVAPLINQVARTSLWYIFGRWGRCAEFTSDRAGLICCGNLSEAQVVEGKLVTGGAQMLNGFNPEEYARQLEKINQSPIRFMEIFQSHPLGPKRVQAMRLFSECEVLYSWRPEMRGSGPVLTKMEVDRACEALVI